MTDQEIRWDWYLINVLPGMMLTVQFEIVTRRLEFLLPKIWRRVLVEGHYRPFPESRLPGGYAFVQLSSQPDDPNHRMLNSQASALKELRGVNDVFKNAAGRYSPVRQWEIDALKDIEAEDHKEAGKARPKFAEPLFPKDSAVRIKRGNGAGQVGLYLFSVRGVATVAMSNGIKCPVPDGDLEAISKGEATRLAG